MEFVLWGLSSVSRTWSGHSVALRYKPEGRGFDSRWCYWNFSLTESFRTQYDDGVDSASNRNKYQEIFPEGEGGRCVGLTTLPSSCADCLEIWDPQPPGTLRGCPGQIFLSRTWANLGGCLSRDDFVKVTSVTKRTMRQEADWHQPGLENPTLGYDKDPVDGTSRENGGIVRIVLNLRVVLGYYM